MEKSSAFIAKDNQTLIFRNQIEKLADELCLAVKGEFDFSIEANSTDETVQKLAMLVNFVIDAARRSLEAVKEQNTKLTELDKLKSDFLANISHELRTPLTLILAPLQTILEESSAISQKDRENLQRVQRNAAKLYTLVNDLLDFSKIEAGKFTLHEELIDLNQLISQLVDDAQGLANERDLTLKFSNVGVFELMLFDRKMVEKMVMNLISNALKFTPAGGHVLVSLEKQEKAIKLSVSDTGIGIPAEKIKNLFNRFYQVDSSSTRYHQGSGIGLSLVSEFVDLMSGEIVVESEEGKGTKFIITLPVQALEKTEGNSLPIKEKKSVEKSKVTPFSEFFDKKQAADVIFFSPKKSAQLPRILIADDSLDMRSYLVSLLKDSYEIIAVENGKLALDAIYKYHPQVVLSDVMMPCLDGYQLTKKVKSDPKIRHIPIVLITAQAGKEAVVSGLSVGADDYLPKPFSPEELKARTNAALRSYQNYTKIIDLNSHLDTAVQELSESKKVLEISNKKLLQEAEERKKLELKNAALNNQLVVAARCAGMTDIATSVLHNVGNVLNSVNISVSTIGETITKSKVSNLAKLSELLHSHKENLEEFIIKDPQGRYVIDYLSELSKVWIDDKNNLLEEVNLLNRSVQHIKDIIVKQNSLSSLLGVSEEIVVSQLVEDALILNKASYEKSQIEVIRDFSPIRKIVTDRVKLLQVIVNLIKNSIESLRESGGEKKQIRLCIREDNDSHLIIRIQDNGVGILSENLKKVFSHGFTTKKGGHGFGLHTSAIFVQEMGGNLSVESDGMGKGATFVLSLPLCETPIS